MTSLFSDCTNSIYGAIDAIGSIVDKTRNIKYTPNKRMTSIGGILNCQMLAVCGKPVALKRDLNTNTVVQLYEEEEESNGETVTVTKSRTLESVLNGKAAASHTHSISDITNLQTTLNSKASSSHTHSTTDLTNWSTATSNFAKLDTSNTFTGTYMYHLRNVSSGTSVYDYIGKSTSSGESLFIRYYYNSTLASRFASMGLTGYAALVFYYNKVHLGLPLDVDSGLTVNSGTLTTPAITLNGSDLATTLNGKASASHTHTLSEITDYTAPDLSGYALTSHNHDGTYAKLSSANTFIGYQTFTNGISLMNSANEIMTLYIGSESGIEKSGCLRFAYISRTSKGYLSLYLYGEDGEGINLWSDKIELCKAVVCSSSLSASSITLNGSDLATTLSGKASSSHTHTCADITDIASTYAKLAANTFTGSQTFNNNCYFNYSPYIYSTSIYHLVSGLSSGGNMYKYMGKSTSSLQGFRVRYYYNTTAASTFAQVGINGYPSIAIYYNKIDVSYPLNVSGAITSTSTVTGTNVKSDNETRLSAAETAIAGKASSSHTHSISDITNLQTTLDGKASSSHTHTCVDITDIASTYAKLTSNTFTGAQTFSNTCYFNYSPYIYSSYIYHLVSGLASGASMYKYMGKSTSSGASFQSRYYYNSTLAYTFGEFGINGYPAVSIYYDHVNISKDTYMTKTLRSHRVLVGDYSSNGNCGGLEFNYVGDNNANNALWLGLYGNSTIPMVIKNDGTINVNSTLNATKAITSTSTITGSKLETTNNTASSAIGSNLQAAIFDLVYPIGSIYMTATNQITGATYNVTSTTVQMTLHGCTFELLPKNRFIKNADWYTFTVQGGGYDWWSNDSAGDTGGSSTHYHSTGNHTLTEAEMPTHSHQYGTPRWLYAEATGGGSWIAPNNYTSGNFNRETTTKGGNQPHNHGNTGSASNLPPYITMYMWKRIA